LQQLLETPDDEGAGFGVEVAERLRFAAPQEQQAGARIAFDHGPAGRLAHGHLRFAVAVGADHEVVGSGAAHPSGDRPMRSGETAGEK
jgi:hypothetical protein